MLTKSSGQFFRLSFLFRNVRPLPWPMAKVAFCSPFPTPILAGCHFPKDALSHCCETVQTSYYGWVRTVSDLCLPHNPHAFPPLPLGPNKNKQPPPFGQPRDQLFRCLIPFDSFPTPTFPSTKTKSIWSRDYIMNGDDANLLSS